MSRKGQTSKAESRLGRRWFKLIKTLEIYGGNGDIKETAKTLGVTPRTVENRILVAVQDFRKAQGWLKEVEKYKSVLYRKETAHSSTIGCLCKIGKAFGYKTWIAPNERSYISNIDGREGILGEMTDFSRKPKLIGVQKRSWDFLNQIDVIWIRNHKICYAFEVETTTTFTRAFDRCSNIPFEYHALRVIVIPKGRKRSLLCCTRSNLILHEIEKGNWYLLEFPSLENLKRLCGKLEESAFKDTLESLIQ